MNVVELYGLDAAAEARGHVVIIDVLRAFTCAACALDLGATEIVLVSTPDEARVIRQGRPDVVLIGAVGGRKIDGFDFGNSPADVVESRRSRPSPFAGRAVAQRTGNGTQGVVRATRADAIYAASLVNASATARHLRAIGAETVSLVAKGAPRGPDGPEDVACRELIAARLRREEPGLARIRETVFRCPAAEELRDASNGIGCGRDVEIACDIDVFGFAMPVVREGGRLVARRVDVGFIGPGTSFETARIVAKFQRAGFSSGEEFDSAATALVAAGYEEPEFFRLIGSRGATTPDLADAFARGVLRAGLALDDWTSAMVETLACATAIARGAEDFRSLARRIREAAPWGPTSYPQDRYVIGYLEDADFRDKGEDEKAATRRLARELLAKYGPPFGVGD